MQIMKKKKTVQPKYDWEMFKLFGGLGSFFVALGIFLFYVAYTAPEPKQSSNDMSLGRELMRMIPSETTEAIVMGFAVLMFLFGVFLLLNCLYRSVKYWLLKAKT